MDFKLNERIPAYIFDPDNLQIKYKAKLDTLGHISMKSDERKCPARLNKCKEILK